ncbi:Alpha/Beta hydrolase protein [Lactifluus volemus]|nr:Alpha/Beta hydrolase protein [Lactifluus volemus]
MCSWIARLTYASLRNTKCYKRCNTYLRVNGTSTSSSLFPLAVSNTLRTAGLLQPSSDAPSGWLVLSAFLGLPLALWAYKCLMLVIFQRKLIYMGYAPPGSRTESLATMYTPKGIQIEEVSVPSSQPKTVRLSTLLLRRNLASPPRHVIVYFQGNAGNPLHRIHVFTTLLNAVPSLAIVAPAPRSYWTSSAARPTQSGLIADYTAALAFTAKRFPASHLIIYGHSLGASIALCLLAPSLKGEPTSSVAVHGLVLENAFTSVPDMLRALYPQRWLPYRYLGPFVRDRWDARAATAAHTFPRGLARRAMVLVSERDEVVPPAMGREIFEVLQASGDAQEGWAREVAMRRLVMIEGALHEDAWRYRDWAQVMKQYFETLDKLDLDAKFGQ